MAPNVDAVARVVEPITHAAGLDCEGVEIRSAGRRSVVRVVVDADGGVSLDAVAAVSGPISDALDDSGVLGDSAYTLEVTSPGVDRPLTQPRHWTRAIGRLVAVTQHDGSSFTARLTAVTPDHLTFTTEGKKREVREISPTSVSRAVVQVEFNAPSDDVAAADSSAPTEERG